MAGIDKAQARIYHFLKREMVQHLGLGTAVFVLVFCLLSINVSWKITHYPTAFPDNWLGLFWLVFREAFLYTLLMGLPVYANYLLFYKGRIQSFVRRRFFSDAQLKGWGFYLFLLFSSLFALVFSLLYAPLISPWFRSINQNWYELFMTIFFLIICAAGASYSRESMENIRNLERMERLEAIRRRREVERELEYLKKQIRPHFLFNTLANLQILASRKSPELPSLIGELSRLLRHLVYRTNDKLTSLEEEIHFIESYIKLQNLQVSKNTELRFQVQGEILPEYRVAPMILLQFVENCFKHYNGKAGNQRKLIDVEFSLDGQTLNVAIRNSYTPNKRNENTIESTASGLGLASAVEQLKLIYGDSYSLRIDPSEDMFVVHLQLPLL
jgi:sensor histidine kinase YesM